MKPEFNIYISGTVLRNGSFTDVEGEQLPSTEVTNEVLPKLQI